MITDIGLQNVALMLSGTLGKQIAQVQVGDNGTAPAPGDTAITNAFSKNFTAITFPNTNEVNFKWSLLAGDNNGNDVEEAGLPAADGTLFNRVTFPVIAKTSSITVQGDFLLQINR